MRTPIGENDRRFVMGIVVVFQYLPEGSATVANQDIGRNILIAGMVMAEIGLRNLAARQAAQLPGKDAGRMYADPQRRVGGQQVFPGVFPEGPGLGKAGTDEKHLETGCGQVR